MPGFASAPGAAASSVNPQAHGVASAGVEGSFSRSDHVHPAQSIPAATASTPLPIGTAAVGVSADYARADHAHAPDVQRIKATTDSAGLYTWTYPVAYAGGVVPVVEAIAVGSSGSTDVINVQINGTPGNTSCQVRVARTQVSVVALIGLSILSIPASVGATVVHITARAP